MLTKVKRLETVTLPRLQGRVDFMRFLGDGIDFASLI